MAKHLWSVLCERISIDQRTNLVSYLTCMEGVTARQLPGAVPTLAIGSLWQRDSDEEHSFVFKLVVVSPDKSEKMLLQGSQDFGPTEKARTNFVMDGFPIEQTGQYVFRIETQNVSDWECRAMLPLDVTLHTGEQAGESGGSVAVSDVTKPIEEKTKAKRGRSGKRPA